MLMTQALVSVSVKKHEKTDKDKAYRDPVRKIAITPIFFPVASCNLDTANTGMNKIKMSLPTFLTPRM